MADVEGGDDAHDERVDAEAELYVNEAVLRGGGEGAKEGNEEAEADSDAEEDLKWDDRVFARCFDAALAGASSRSLSSSLKAKRKAPMATTSAERRPTQAGKHQRVLSVTEPEEDPWDDSELRRAVSRATALAARTTPVTSTRADATPSARSNGGGDAQEHPPPSFLFPDVPAELHPLLKAAYEMGFAVGRLSRTNTDFGRVSTMRSEPAVLPSFTSY